MGAVDLPACADHVSCLLFSPCVFLPAPTTAAALLDLTDPNEPDQLAKLRALVNAHWRGDAMRKALRKVQNSHENATYLRSNEWVQYWLDECDRVLAEGYLPTSEDMLKLRRPTNGEQVLQFTMRKQAFELVDLGGQTHEMKSWAHHMEQDIAGVVFMLSLADFDKRDTHGHWASAWSRASSTDEVRSTNRLEEGLQVLNDILRSTPALQVLPLVIMLNKVDLFEDRIKRGKKFHRYFDACPREFGRNALKARQWLVKEVSAPTDNRFFSAPHGKMTCFSTCATDSSQAEKMIDNVFDAVLMNNMETLGI